MLPCREWARVSARGRAEQGSAGLGTPPFAGCARMHRLTCTPRGMLLRFCLQDLGAGRVVVLGVSPVDISDINRGQLGTKKGAPGTARCANFAPLLDPGADLQDSVLSRTMDGGSVGDEQWVHGPVAGEQWPLVPVLRRHISSTTTLTAPRALLAPLQPVARRTSWTLPPKGSWRSWLSHWRMMPWRSSCATGGPLRAGGCFVMLRRSGVGRRVAWAGAACS